MRLIRALLFNRNLQSSVNDGNSQQDVESFQKINEAIYSIDFHRNWTKLKFQEISKNVRSIFEKSSVRGQKFIKHKEMYHLSS